MEKMMAKLSDNLLDKFSMDFLRSQVLKNAYGNEDGVIVAVGVFQHLTAEKRLRQR